MGWSRTSVNRIDAFIGRITGRTVLVDARTPMNFAILAPIFERLQRDPRVTVLFTAERPHEAAVAAAAAGVRSHIHPRREMQGRGVALSLTADPWDPIQLRR